MMALKWSMTSFIASSGDRSSSASPGFGGAAGRRPAIMLFALAVLGVAAAAGYVFGT